MIRGLFGGRFSGSTFAWMNALVAFLPLELASRSQSWLISRVDWPRGESGAAPIQPEVSNEFRVPSDE